MAKSTSIAPCPASEQPTIRRANNVSPIKSAKRVERTLLSAAFEVDFDLEVAFAFDLAFALDLTRRPLHAGAGPGNTNSLKRSQAPNHHSRHHRKRHRNNARRKNHRRGRQRLHPR